ncbi:MAG TPA: cation:proton antiporter [Thermomonas sp.]|nr:cation:proton antiporter [Thermomonas sp.]
MTATLQVLLQLVIILVAARLCGAALMRFGQPPVIGEMAAGLLLGPIAFGAWWPELHAVVFAKATLPVLSGLATLGVSLFMFIVGADLRAPEGSRAQVRSAFTVGSLGMLVPMSLGLAIAPVLHARFAPAGVGFWPFALFVAATMSVTAFPVLARILRDRNLTRSVPGRLALGAAMIDDVCVWILLAMVLAMTGRSSGGALLAIGGGVALVATVLLAVKPLMARALPSLAPMEELPLPAFAWIMIGVLACAAFAEWIGLHAIFGAFLFGVALPRDDRLLQSLGRRIEPVAVVLLMPVMFALAGQNATPEVFAGAGLGAFALVLAVAVLGKVAGCALGARLGGHDWRESLAVGSLMNARGLMELVVIRIGLEAGLIGPGLFTLLFAMTLVTTLMASPLLSLFHARRADAMDNGRAA